MSRRQPVPKQWLFTDERMGDDLWRAVERLPRSSGIVFRHYATAPADRAAMFERIRRVARRRGLVLIRAGQMRFRGEHGVHGGVPRKPGGLRTRAAHSRAEAVAGIRRGADVVFVSPVYATRSHPTARSLGPLKAARIGHGICRTVIALGGMDARSYRKLEKLGFDGWAGIDAWLRPQPYQKRKAVPI